jgi:hypothetical protein
MEVSASSYSDQLVLLSGRDCESFNAKVARLQSAAPPRRIAVMLF